jgi:hypothetical protein
MNKLISMTVAATVMVGAMLPASAATVKKEVIKKNHGHTVVVKKV